MPKSAKLFIENLDKRLRELGWTQKQLADQMGIPASTVFKWKSGEVKPGLDALDRLAESLGLTADQLISGAQAPKAVVQRETVTERIPVDESIREEALKAAGEAADRAAQEATAKMLTAAEMTLVTHFRRCDESTREDLLTTAEFLAEQKRVKGRAINDRSGETGSKRAGALVQESKRKKLATDR